MRLPPKLTMADAAAALAALRAEASGDRLAIDASALVDLDSAALALLLHARRLAADRGQAFELSVQMEEPDAGRLREAFHAAHEDAYGYRDPEAEVELVTLRATATEPGPDIDPAAVGQAAAGAERARRETVYGDTQILRGEPEPGEPVEGPAVVELPEATLAVPDGWAGEVLESGTIRIEKT